MTTPDEAVASGGTPVRVAPIVGTLALKKELAGLSGRIMSLQAYIDSPQFDTQHQKEKGRMIRQLRAMYAYHEILSERICAKSSNTPGLLRQADKGDKPCT